MSALPNGTREYVNPDVTPYVISADVGGLVGQWGTRNGLHVPSTAFFDGITAVLARGVLEATGHPVDVVPETELRDGMEKLIDESPYPVVSLDRAYVDEASPKVAGFLDITRAVKEVTHPDGSIGFEAVGDLEPRPGQPTLEEQLEALRSNEPSPITLVDDVIFTGEGGVKLAEKLAEIGRPVARVVAGIGIKEGIDRLEAAGIEVVCVRAYADVVDEVCERDFIAGVPMSGRTVVDGDGRSWSAPYFEPYGNTARWASIPDETARAFSKLCLSASWVVWDELNRSTGQTWQASDVPRPLKSANGQAMTTLLLNDYLQHQ